MKGSFGTGANRRRFTYQSCQAFNTNGTCGTWSSSKTINLSSTGSLNATIANGRATVGSNIGYISDISFCQTIKRDATGCDAWGATSQIRTNSDPKDAFSTFSNVRQTGRYTVQYCTAINQSSGQCSSWANSDDYTGNTTPTAATLAISITKRTRYNTYRVQKCNEGSSYGTINYNNYYTNDGECKSWKSAEDMVSEKRPEEYREDPRTISVSKSQNRNPNTTYLVLNSPYGNPEAEVSVSLLHCDNDTDPVSACHTINFANVQPIVDATGRANDLFRRVEARIELIDTYFPIANFALVAEDPDSDNDNVKKDFYVTSSCHYSESYSDGSEIKYDSSSCKDAGDRSASIAPSM